MTGMQSFYCRYGKRALDIASVGAAVGLFWWLFILLAFMVRIKLGSPIIFAQKRPGKDEKIFTLYKFRTMTDARDEEGRLLPDGVRLTSFGKWLRSTSLDELPEFYNVLKGDMSLIGPRPQLVRDMVFMTPEQRMRHTVRPGISGLAQVSGRNAVRWEDKLQRDLVYLERVSFWEDMKIVFLTIYKVFKREGITEEGMDTAEDYGDYLLRVGKVTAEEYKERQNYALQIMENA